MAVDISCFNCGENFGKDVENPKKITCGNCGQTNINNPRGYDNEQEDKNADKD